MMFVVYKIFELAFSNELNPINVLTEISHGMFIYYFLSLTLRFYKRRKERKEMGVAV